MKFNFFFLCWQGKLLCQLFSITRWLPPTRQLCNLSPNIHSPRTDCNDCRTSWQRFANDCCLIFKHKKLPAHCTLSQAALISAIHPYVIGNSTQLVIFWLYSGDIPTALWNSTHPILILIVLHFSYTFFQIIIHFLTLHKDNPSKSKMQFSNEKNSNTLGICKKKRKKKELPLNLISSYALAAIKHLWQFSVSLSHRCGDDLEAKLAGMFQISPCVLKLQGINWWPDSPSEFFW